MAPTEELSTITSDWPGGETVGFQPRMRPSSLAKMNRAGPTAGPFRTTKLALPLKTMPVGPPATATTSARGTPSPPYSLERSVPLLETHHGLVELAVMPQPFTRFGSTRSGASAGSSDTRLCCL